LSANECAFSNIAERIYTRRADTATSVGGSDPNGEMKIMRRSVWVTTITLVGAFLAGQMQAASNEPANSTPQQVFDGMRQSFQAEKAKGVHAKYQWELSGPNGGDWWIDVEDGTFKMGKGKIDNPTVT